MYGADSCAPAFCAYDDVILAALKLGAGLSVKCEGEKLRYGKLEKRVVSGAVANGDGFAMCSTWCMCIADMPACDVASTTGGGGRW